MTNRNSSRSVGSVGSVVPSEFFSIKATSPFRSITSPLFGENDVLNALDQLADELLSPRFKPRLKEIYQTNSKFPCLEILRDLEKDILILKLHISGYDKNKISLEYDHEQQALIVSGEKESSEGQNNEEIFYSEVKKSNFERRIPVSFENIKDIDKIESTAKDGILEIKIPFSFEEKKKEKSRKKIQIE